MLQSQCMSPEAEASIERLKKPGVSILKEILRRIKLKDDLVKENNEILHEFLRTFLLEMKKDELFNSLFQECHFTGSFYSDLRVSKPDEFDINLVLKLPFKDSDFEVTPQPQTPSYVKYFLRTHREELAKNPRLVSTLFEDGYLIAQRVREWLQSVVDKAMKQYRIPSSCISVGCKQSGPARTILLKKRKGGEIDIDLVPVVSHKLNLSRNSVDLRVLEKVGSPLKAFLVPKPYSNVKQMPVSAIEAKRLWRSHFPEAEETLIYNVGCVKPVIKLLKSLRDGENWKILASYYLKTVVIWMILDNSHDQSYWNEDKMDVRFLDALQRLSESVSRRKIQYVFNKKYNLIEKINPSEAANIRNRIDYWIRIIQLDKNKLWTAFHQTPSFPHSGM